ncbi:Protein of unknown function [Gryllus bimaculatus]|nr:Protein of unknown function [Gryllus bimaculatus]
MGSPSSLKSEGFDAILDFVLREASGHVFGSQKIPDVNKTFQVPMPMGLGGTLSELTLRVEVLLTPSFSAELRCLRVEKMGPLRADVTGLGEWGFTWPTIQEALLPVVQKHLEHEVVERVEPILRKGLWQLSRFIAAIPKIRLLPETDGSPKMIGALEMEPSITLTPSTIAAGGGLVVSGISLLGVLLGAAFGSSGSRSDDDD